MKIFTQEFRDAVKGALDQLEEGMYLTREHVCLKIGLTAFHANAISILLSEPEFAEDYELVKSRGIRLRREPFKD